MKISDLPPELLDSIVLCIPIPFDLLSLARACKAFHAIIVPDHLNSRVVRCDVRGVTVWLALTQQPAVAARISTLELIDDNLAGGNRIPAALSPHLGYDSLKRAQASEIADEFGAQALADAIRMMSGVTRMCWIGNTHLRAYRLAPGNGVKSVCAPIFASLTQNCPQLRDIEIIARDLPHSIHLVDAPLWKFSNLKRVSVTVSRFTEVSTAICKHFPAMFDMLDRCPELQDLRLAFARKRRGMIDLSECFKDRFWPRLNVLILEGDLHSSLPAITDFLERHPSLKILSLSEMDVPASSFPATMPYVRWLSMRSTTWTSFDLATKFPRLEYAATASPSAMLQVEQEVSGMPEVLSTVPTLRGVTILANAPGLLKKLAEAVPRLERLTLASAPWNPHRRKARVTRIPDAECLATLASFKLLTHLDTAVALRADQRGPYLGDALERLLRSLADVLPHLLYVGVDIIQLETREGAPRHAWYLIARGPHGDFAGAEEMRDLRRVRFHDWDDVFRNISA
ncbi:hypothetical protein GGX14DRAFT_566973 [Mycena pura]|uniref:F-box domain-containing protein n=1 Tax=Mycena pura TaxID=153505 RepID=A0AAD6VBG8_9AGAR|nr:hypothetical protein GGX14DRAFT_566973 [Mycena pura]